MRRLLALGAVILTGCPISNGFGGRVVTASGLVETISFTADNHEVVGAALQPVVGAQVRCDGCRGKVVMTANGSFSVDLGNAHPFSSDPGPIVLHATAPGYDPIDIEMPRPPGSTEYGGRMFVIVMTRASSLAPR